MEVKAIGQGGQTAFNTSNTNAACKVDGQPTEIEKKPEVQPKEPMENKELKEKDLKKVVDKLNKFLEDENTHAEYQMHEKFNQVMIKIIDNNTGKVIRELPPKKIIDMVAKLCEMVGVLVDKKA